MKTFIEWDKAKNKYVPKLAQLQACLEGGEVLGTTGIDLADYANPNKYLKNLTLNETTNGIGSSSFIIVEIRTFDAAKQAVSFGRIIGSINHENGFSQMPSGGDKLDQCTIDKITNWVENGAPW